MHTGLKLVFHPQHQYKSDDEDEDDINIGDAVKWFVINLSGRDQTRLIGTAINRNMSQLWNLEIWADLVFCLKYVTYLKIGWTYMFVAYFEDWRGWGPGGR